MMKRFLFPALLGLTGLGIFIMALTGALDPKPLADFVQGEIDGDRIDLGAKFSARVAEVLKNDGERVAPGEVVLRLEDTEMRARVDQAAEELRQARAALEKTEKGPREEEIRRLRGLHEEARAALVRARQHHTRSESLFTKRAVSRQDVEEAVKGLRQAEARVAQSKAALDEALTGARAEDLEAARAQVSALEARLAEVTGIARDLDLASPIGGEVSKVLVKRGELVSAGYPLATLVDLDDLWAVAMVREDRMANIRMGRTAAGSVPALGGREVLFKIDYIAPLGNFATWRATNDSASFDLKTFEVRGRPVAPVEGLRPGMSVVFASGAIRP